MVNNAERQSVYRGNDDKNWDFRSIIESSLLCPLQTCPTSLWRPGWPCADPFRPSASRPPPYHASDPISQLTPPAPLSCASPPPARVLRSATDRDAIANKVLFNVRKIIRMITTPKINIIGDKRTVYSSTCRCNSASRFRRFAPSVPAASSSSPSWSRSAFSTRRFLPITSSARRCCLSAGVSVQSELSTVFGVAAERENWRGLFSLVGSSAV
jgi:hypothetical protein